MSSQFEVAGKANIHNRKICLILHIIVSLCIQIVLTKQTIRLVKYFLIDCWVDFEAKSIQFHTFN